MNKEKIWYWIVGVVLLIGFGLSIYIYGLGASIKTLLLSLLIALIMVIGVSGPYSMTGEKRTDSILGIVLVIFSFIVSYVLIIN